MKHRDFNKNLKEEKENTLGLTDQEKSILDHFVEVWNELCDLPKRSEADAIEMQEIIHRGQQLIALRVARRIDVDYWNQPN
jgi:hypothetical protein